MFLVVDNHRQNERKSYEKLQRILQLYLGIDFSIIKHFSNVLLAKKISIQHKLCVK